MLITIFFNHIENAMRAEGSSTSGLLGYDKSNKTFSCEASDLDCAGVPDIPHQFNLEILANGHRKTFSFSKEQKDAEGELEYYLFTASNGFKFMVFND
jgi:hypothetical protein